MTTNVTYTNQVFYINEDKRTVVCKLDFCVDLSKIDNFKYIAAIPAVYNYLNVHSSNNTDLKINFSVKGKAKADKSDKFDKELGKNLALTRAQGKAFNTAVNFYSTISKLISANINKQLSKLMTGSYDAEQTAYAHEYKLMGIKRTFLLF